MNRILRSIKALMPHGLFARAVLLLVAPLLISELVGTKVFYDRFWSTVMRRLATGVTTNISLVVDRRPFHRSDEDDRVFARVNSKTGLEFHFIHGGTLPLLPASEPETSIERFLTSALADQRLGPFEVDASGLPTSLQADIQLPEGLLQVTVPRDRIYTSVTYVFLLWMTGSAFLSLGIATMVLRNQVRAVRRLAIAAEAFGKGRDVEPFRPEGATEVRQAAAAFLVMRERIQRQMTQRTEMLAGVSHDLRTPLTRMKLELELLDETEEIVGLKSDVSEMQQMIEGYLSFARGEGNEAQQVVNIVELLEELVAAARRGGAEISLAAPDELYVPVRRDSFRRCIVNLVGNAERYGGHVWITLVADRAAVELMIDDDGPGIPIELREEVFRPFYRLESSRNPSTGGVGLGLTIARDIMRGHGGDLFLETSPQGGLRARIVLPR
ncbi:MAG TPA: ATP-binding protein [Aliidongia sp.]|nr:ATP-binding protein [Aliidongia sp.]